MSNHSVEIVPDVFVTPEDARALEVDQILYGNGFIKRTGENTGRRIPPYLVDRDPGDEQPEEET